MIIFRENSLIISYTRKIGTLFGSDLGNGQSIKIRFQLIEIEIIKHS